MKKCDYGCGEEAKFELNGRKGIKKQCCSKSSNSCSAIKEKKRQAYIKKYGVDNPGKVKELHEKRLDTLEKKYGDRLYNTHGIRKPENQLKAYENGIQKWETKHGNCSTLEYIKNKKKKTMLKNWGVESPLQHPEILKKAQQTNNQLYGGNSPMNSAIIIKKMIETKIERYGEMFVNSAGWSKEAMLWIRNYVKEQKYDISQIAYYDIELGLHEWGQRLENDKWILYDFVAFELGHRGDKDYIIEIVEYHGPWHYTDNDVKNRGEEKAALFKNSNTIKESRDIDLLKEEYGKQLTNNYKVIWAYDIDKGE